MFRAAYAEFPPGLSGRGLPVWHLHVFRARSSCDFA
jgi:hypothetical protein